jgi:6-phosphogluconate dehydrogenase
MRIGFIGLGKMGSRMVERLLLQGFEVVVYARNPLSMKPLSEKGAIESFSYQDFCSKLPEKKIVFIMVTHGKPVDEVISNLLPYIKKGDIIVDSGNSFYEDSIARAKRLQKKGIKFLDAGISGGLEGAINGSSIMVGGDKDAFNEVEPVFKALAVQDGYELLGPVGAGHFVKMVHNGIEYCFLQALGEGYLLLEKSNFKFDLRKVTKVYKNGSVIRSWLVDLLARSLQNDPKLLRFEGHIGGGDTGKWTILTAKKYGLKLPSLEVALKARKKSMAKPDFSSKVVSALRHEFGGHQEPNNQKK